MSASNVDGRVKAVIVEHLGVAADQVANDAKFADDLGADSLDALDLLMAINEEFGIRIPAEQLPDIHTVKQMVDIVKKKGAQ